MLSNGFEQIAGEDAVADGQENVVLKSRTAVQAAASRVNGSKSRGPKTAAGKSRACRNALRHGLLAYRIRPLEEDFDLQHEYDLQLKGLVREFDPVTTTEWMMVETLASDMVQLGRAMEVGEAEGETGVRPIAGPSMAPDSQGDIELVSCLIKDAESGAVFSCPADELNRLIKYLIANADRLEEEGEAIRGYRDSGHKIEDYEETLLADVTFINPSELGMRKPEHAAAVLRGECTLEADRRDRWEGDR